MSKAIDMVFARLPREEGERNDAYDDVTGRTVRAPVGMLTWGRGFNLSQCASKGLFDVMEQYLLQQCESELTQLSWYPVLDDARKSVILDMAYNMGVKNLLHYPKMITFLMAKDWVNAANECHVKQQSVDSTRYAALRAILALGAEPSA